MEIDKLERQLGQILPQSVIDIWRLHNGTSGRESYHDRCIVPGFYLLSIEESQKHGEYVGELLPRSRRELLPVMADQIGGYVLVDLKSNEVLVVGSGAETEGLSPSVEAFLGRIVGAVREGLIEVDEDGMIHAREDVW